MARAPVSKSGMSTCNINGHSENPVESRLK